MNKRDTRIKAFKDKLSVKLNKIKGQRKLTRKEKIKFTPINQETVGDDNL
jgi:hypothetical protein